MTVGEIAPGLGAIAARCERSIGLDWKLPGVKIASRLLGAARSGAIFCLHDGRELRKKPDVAPTLEAVRRLVPELLERGYLLKTVSELCRTIDLILDVGSNRWSRQELQRIH